MYPCVTDELLQDQEMKGYKSHDNEELRGFLEEQLELLDLKEDRMFQSVNDELFTLCVSLPSA